MRRTGSVVLVMLLVLTPGIQAQEAQVLMRTPVELELIHHINSKYSPVGTKVWLRVAEDVIQDGQVVIAEGAWAEGVIQSAEKSKSLGRAGAMSFELRTVAAIDGSSLPLDGTAGASGRQRTGATVGMIVGFGVLGLFSKGRMAYAIKGTLYTGYIAADRTVSLGTRSSDVESDVEVVTANASIKPPRYELKIEKGKKLKPIEITVAMPAGVTARKMALAAIDRLNLPEPVEPISSGGGSQYRMILDGWSVVQFCGGGRSELVVQGEATDGRLLEAAVSLDLLVKKKR